MSITLSTTPNEQRQAFFALKTVNDLASLLEIDSRRLIYHLYQVPDDSKYEVFLIPKRSGGMREIAAPVTALKIIQSKLSEVLSNVYKPKQPVFGYVQEKNIVGNARKHRRRRYVFNLDLEDFFPTINFGRVRGLFIAKPYSLPPQVATVIAQICIHKNYLPQGAPTSPIISNMICARKDRQLQLLAKNNKCYYTRYADDIVFSTSLKEFPEAIAKPLALTEVELGDTIQAIIKGNGFSINEGKIRLSLYFRRQEVTGLTVNEFPNVRRSYVREIRAMLHAWDKFGVLKAESDFFQKYDHTHRNPKLRLPTYRQVVKGKIEFLGMVRGKDNEIYQDFLRHYSKLLRRDRGIPSISAFELSDIDRPHIYTEGITDTLILMVAWQKLYSMPCPFVIVDSSPIRRSAPDESGGGASILREFLNNVREDHPHIVVGVFDRDGEGLKEYKQLRNDYAEHNDSRLSKSRNAAALLLPIPTDREEYARLENLCIEYFFADTCLELKTPEGYGLVFEFPQITQRIGNTSIVETIPNTRLETRKIRSGKSVFAKKIVPTLLPNEFESFKPLFEKIIELVQILDAQKST